MKSKHLEISVLWFDWYSHCDDKIFVRKNPNGNTIPKLWAFSKTHRPRNIYKAHHLWNTANLRSNWLLRYRWMAAHWLNWLTVTNRSNNFLKEDLRENILNFKSEISDIIPNEEKCAGPIMMETVGFVRRSLRNVGTNRLFIEKNTASIFSETTVKKFSRFWFTIQCFLHRKPKLTNEDKLQKENQTIEWINLQLIF